jgi:hypothetical protein
MGGVVPEQPSVLVVGGPLDGHEVRLSPGLNMIVGSGRLANLRLDHPEIELAHIKIIWDDLGISMIDNGSRKGTWVNGEQVETAGLIDGDTIEFAAPGSKVTPPPPKVKLRIPKGSVPDAPPPPPPPPEAVAKPAGGLARAAGQARVLVRSQRSALRMPELRMPDVDVKRLALGAFGLLALVLAGWLVKRLFFTAPQIDNLEPAQAEMGQEITITGDRFDADAVDNKVWFDTLPVVPGAATGHSLLVRVPVLPASGPVALSVETSSGRSRPVSLTALAPLRVTAVDPPGALPGDEVVLRGSGFAEGLSVTVGGQPASLVKTEPHEVRFQMPQLSGTPGSVHQVLVAWGGRNASPVQLYLGRLPLVSAVEPARGVAGDLVRVRGAGFSAETTLVSFDGQPALVAAAGASELLVVVPPSSRSEAEALVPVVVHARGRASSEAPGFTLQRLVEGTWVPRFIAGAVGEGGATGQATVGTELAPVLLLSANDESRSTGERALAVAKALDAAVDRARVGQAVAFEAREQPEICVALVGAPDRLLKVLPQDAAAYETPPGEPARGAPPTTMMLARHWAALLTDTVAIATSAAKPRATAELGPPWSVAFTQLRAALPWQYGSGVASARVVAVSPELKRMLREAALRVP